MNIHEILGELDSKGVKITSRTLLKYEKDSLIPEPKRGGLGYGKGKVTEYPDQSVVEAYAAFQLLNGVVRTTPKMLKEIREYALAFENNPTIEPPRDIEVGCLFELWFVYRERAKTGQKYILEFIEQGNKNYHRLIPIK